MTSTVGKLMTASIKNHFIEGNPGFKFNFLALFFLHYHLGQFCSDVDGDDIDDGDDGTTLVLGLFRWFP